MTARYNVLALTAAATLLSATSAFAQTEGKLFEGVSTYYLLITSQTDCGLTEDFVRKKALFPLSYSELQPGTLNNSDLLVQVIVNVAELPATTKKCYGNISVTASVMNWNDEIPFNKKNSFSSIILFEKPYIFIGYDLDSIGRTVEEFTKELVTTINLDNK